MNQLACDRCRKLKRRCDLPRDSTACQRCQSNSSLCVFDADKLPSDTVQSKGAESILSSRPHMSIDPDVESTYPLDSYISVINDLLLPPSSNSQPNGSRHSFKPQQNFHHRPQNLLDEDYQYLLTKGAFCLPHPELRNKLLRAYVTTVHPLLPVLDLAPFFDRVLYNESSFPSPLLYQAVMLAGSAFVEDKDATAAGYMCRRALREALFERCKLLYEFDTESSCYAQIQALLLMAQWHGGDASHKDPCFWLDIAVSTAERIGLDSNIGPGSLALPDRIWWCLYVRDRIISLGFRRPMRIRSSPPEIQMLGSGEAHYEDLDGLTLDTLADAASLLSKDGQVQMNALFIGEVKLAHCVGVLLAWLYEDTWMTVATNNCVYSLTLKEEAPPAVVDECEELLMKWMRELPVDLHYIPNTFSLYLEGNTLENVMLVHRAFLHLLYLTSLSAVYRVRTDPNNTNTDQVRNLSSSVQSILDELYQLQLLLLLPGTAVTVLASMVEITIADLRRSDGLIRSQAMLNLYAYEHIAIRMLETYPAAHMVLSQAQDVRLGLLGLREE